MKLDNGFIDLKKMKPRKVQKFAKKNFESPVTVPELINSIGLNRKFSDLYDIPLKEFNGFWFSVIDCNSTAYPDCYCVDFINIKHVATKRSCIISKRYTETGFYVRQVGFRSQDFLKKGILVRHDSEKGNDLFVLELEKFNGNLAYTVKSELEGIPYTIKACKITDKSVIKKLNSKLVYEDFHDLVISLINDYCGPRSFFV